MIDQNITKKLQVYEIDILKQIDRICRKYRITYFAVGGTALGAVRHQGFIPWDDDIDIAMAREDYEKFLKVLPKELPTEYHVQNYFTEPKTPFYFTKIRRNNTKFVEYYIKDHDIHHGIFVDVFPFDNIPDNPTVQKIHFRIGRILYQMFLAKSLKTVFSSKEGQKKGYKSYLRLLLHHMLWIVPKKWIFHALNSWVQMFNHKETKVISHVVRRRLRANVAQLYPVRYLEFDGFQMPVPNDYDAYLSAQFGDYMTLPPKNKRHTHLPYLVEFDNGGGKK